MRKLYGYYRSSAAYRVRIALGLKGLAFDSVPVNLVPGVSEQKSANYMALNPQGRVPFLEDGDIALSQSPAILEYLDEAYPDVPLLPADIDERARVRQLSNLVACDIHPINNLSVLQRLKSQFDADDEATQIWYRHWITEGFTALEELLSSQEETGRFCHGDAPTLADVYLVPQVWNAHRFKVDMEAFPTIGRIYDACNEIDAFRAAAPEKQPDAPK
jgi:maleylacetoacetate isomerase